MTREQLEKIRAEIKLLDAYGALLDPQVPEEHAILRRNLDRLLQLQSAMLKDNRKESEESHLRLVAARVQDNSEERERLRLLRDIVGDIVKE